MPNELIHSTAIVSETAKIGKDVKIGPYSIVGPDVEIGDGCVLHSHVVIDGHTKIGKNNEFYQFCSIGAAPQDYTYKGEPTRVEIGYDNVFRECVSVHRASTKENHVTTVGNGSLFMAYVHIGHDAVVGDKCTLVNSVNIAGHVKIGDNVIIGGGTNISQFITLGRGCYIGGATAINRDIPIFCTAYGNRVKLKGINIIGMRRQGYSKQVVAEVVDFLRAMESSHLSSRAFIDHDEYMMEFKGNEVIAEMIEDIRRSEIGVAPFMMS